MSTVRDQQREEATRLGKVRNVIYIKPLMLDTDNFITCTESNAVRLIFSSVMIDWARDKSSVLY